MPTSTLSAFGGSCKPDKVFDLRDGKQKQQQKQKNRSLRLVQKYDAPFPEGFNDDPSEASVRFRFEWCEAHRLDKAKESVPTPLYHDPLEDELGEPAALVRLSAPPTPPPSSAPPHVRGGNDVVSVAEFQCPACDYGHRYGYSVAEHIEEKHPELGQQSFPVECPQCTWGKAWNKVDNNRARRDAELAEHLETQHNPKSPRYDPWGACGCKDWHSLSRCTKKTKVGLGI